MRVEIGEGTSAEDVSGQGPIAVFPPAENYVDLRENPHAVEQIALARQHLPLRNFLAIINSPESVFLSLSSKTQSDSPAAGSVGSECEFASEARLVFAESSLNFVRDHYTELTAGTKELLEREPGDTVRALLRISHCEFTAENRRGFCLTIRLVARGQTAEQAEMRWGLGLARLQQALLFSTRTLRQQLGEAN